MYFGWTPHVIYLFFVIQNNKLNFFRKKIKQAPKFSEDPHSGLLTHTHTERETERGLLVEPS